VLDPQGSVVQVRVCCGSGFGFRTSEFFAALDSVPRWNGWNRAGVGLIAPTAFDNRVTCSINQTLSAILPLAYVPPCCPNWSTRTYVVLCRACRATYAVQSNCPASRYFLCQINNDGEIALRTIVVSELLRDSVAVSDSVKQYQSAGIYFPLYDNIGMVTTVTSSRRAHSRFMKNACRTRPTFTKICKSCGKRQLCCCVLERIVRAVCSLCARRLLLPSSLFSSPFVRTEHVSAVIKEMPLYMSRNIKSLRLTPRSTMRERQQRRSRPRAL